MIYPSDLKDDAGGYVLAKDMVLGTWNISIGTEDKPFSMVFYGDDYTITVGDSAGMGLFGKLAGATVEHLQFNIKLNTTASMIGGLANTADAAVVNDIIGEVDIYGNEDVGGLVGYDISGRFKNVHIAGTVTSAGNHTGGLIGNGNMSNLISCTSSKITVHSNGDSAGVMVGYGEGVTIDKSVVSEPCEVKCAAKCGAVAGWLSASSNVANTTSTCSVEGLDGGMVGGFIGSVESSMISHSFTAGTVRNNKPFSGGFVGLSTESEIIECVSFSSVNSEDGACGGFVGESTAVTAKIGDSAAFGDVTCNGDFVGGFMGSGYGHFNSNLAVNRVSGKNTVGGFAAAIRQPPFSVNDFYAFVRLMSTEGVYYYFANTNGNTNVENVYYYDDDPCNAASCEIADVDYGDKIQKMSFDGNTIVTPDFGDLVECTLFDGEHYNITVPGSIKELVLLGCSE
jgi:hypothetical protein